MYICVIYVYMVCISIRMGSLMAMVVMRYTTNITTGMYTYYIHYIHKGWDGVVYSSFCKRGAGVV